MINLPYDSKGAWKYLTTFLFQAHCFLFCTAFFVSSTTLARDTETTHTTESHSNNSKKNTSYTDIVLAEELSAATIWFGTGEEVTIATRHEAPMGKAPNVVTIITDTEIKNSGYRTLSELLRVVPGFEILKEAAFGEVSLAVRGVAGAEKIRMMINGHLINDPLSGHAFVQFDDFPLENIKKIEIIRGPGSAVYGENAFLAVINIITKEAKDIDGIKMSSGYGSFNTYEENIVFGKSYKDVNVSGMIRYRKTDGFDGVVESDIVTSIDNVLAGFDFPPVSQAPGEVDDWRREFDLNLKVTYKDFYLEGLYINKNQGPFIGPQFAITDESDIEKNYVFGEIGYKKTFEEKFTLKPRLYYDQFDTNSYIEALPEGVTIPVNSGGTTAIYTYSDGFIGHGLVTERIVGTEIPFDYELFDGNMLTLGLEYRLINQTNIRYFTNFDPVTLAPLDSLQDFSDTYPWLKDATRRIGSIYLQDVWDVTNTLNVTFGARYDNYSDFGGEISPRLGVTWAFIKNASLKLLYGKAFRPPNFLEMFTTNQPAILGNEDLNPEIIHTYEIGASYQFNKYITSNINYFYNDIEDLISLRTLATTQGTSRYENFGDAHVQGIETETKITIAKGNYVFMNYTFQNAEDNRGNDLPFVAKHKGNFGVNVHSWKYINTNLSTFVSGRRSREEDDTRSDLPAYALLNLSIIGKEFFKTMEVQGTVYNLLDKDYSDPGPSAIEDDLPRPGRTFFVGLSYQF